MTKVESEWMQALYYPDDVIKWTNNIFQDQSFCMDGWCLIGKLRNGRKAHIQPP